MKRSTVIITALIALSLGITYYVPLWTIDLDAPQYPEGLGLQIWLSEIKGDLNTINNLNHYIGMKTINPESITELKLMPFLIGAIGVLGLAASILRKRWFFTVWALSFLMLSVVGMVDFYLWEYDYGHDLDPTAAIQVPGMTYQPPLIGAKDLLNFRAYSFPGIGGYILIAGVLLSLVMLVFEWRPTSRKGKSAEGAEPVKEKSRTKKLSHAAAMLSVLAFLSSCEAQSQPINYGTDQCAFCKMSITDSRFGTEIVTKKGKAFKYDSIECLLRHLKDDGVKEDNIHSVLITDFTKPGNLVDAKTAHYLISKNLPSPMGAFLSGYSNETTAREFQKKHQGDLFSWDQIRKEFKD